MSAMSTTADANGSTTIKHPDAKPVHESFMVTLRDARSLEVKTSDDHVRGNEILKALKGAQRVILQGDPSRSWEGFDGPVAAANKVHKFLTNLRAMALAPYEEAYVSLNQRMLAFEAQKKREAEEAARKLQEEARRLEEERALADAIAAEEAGDKKAADAILEQPVSVPAVAVTPAIPKVAGRSVRDDYKGRVVDFLKLVQHVAAHPEDLGVLKADESAINERAKSQRQGFNLPGCELVVVPVVSTRI